MPYPAFIEGNDVAIADILNNTSGSHPRTVNNTTVSAGDIRGNTPRLAFDVLTAAEEAWFPWLAANGEIPVNADMLQNLAGVGGPSFWASGDKAVMEKRMLALMQRQSSRADEISGTIGVSSVAPADVRSARLL